MKTSTEQLTYHLKVQKEWIDKGYTNTNDVEFPGPTQKLLNRLKKESRIEKIKSLGI